MKVLWFSNSPCGSVKRFSQKVTRGGWLISLEDELKKHEDIELSVAYISSKKEEPFDYEGAMYYPVLRESSSNPIRRILQRYKNLAEMDTEIFPRLLEVVNKCQPDIIHIHGTEESFGLIMNEVCDIPIVISIQGLIAPYTEKYFSGLPKRIVERYESLFDRIKGVGIGNSYRSFCERAPREMGYLSKSQYIIGRTMFDRRVSLLANPKMKYFRGEEIMRKSFYEAKWKGGGTAARFIIVSTISGGTYKGYETLLHAATLLKQYADFDFEWQVIGYDSDSQWVRIAEKYKNMKSADANICFMGRCTAEQMVEILVNADVYCHVSHIENSPNSVCEAMLLGMPVIATVTGGTQSLLTEGTEGYLIQDGDPYTCAGTIVEIQQNKERAKKMGENARKRALVRHDPQRVTDSLVETYSRILEDFNGGGK